MMALYARLWPGELAVACARAIVDEPARSMHPSRRAVQNKQRERQRGLTSIASKYVMHSTSCRSHTCNVTVGFAARQEGSPEFPLESACQHHASTACQRSCAWCLLAAFVAACAAGAKQQTSACGGLMRFARTRSATTTHDGSLRWADIVDLCRSHPHAAGPASAMGCRC